MDGTGLICSQRSPGQSSPGERTYRGVLGTQGTDQSQGKCLARTFNFADRLSPASVSDGTPHWGDNENGIRETLERRGMLNSWSTYISETRLQRLHMQKHV